MRRRKLTRDQVVAAEAVQATPAQPQTRRGRYSFPSRPDPEEERRDKRNAALRPLLYRVGGATERELVRISGLTPDSLARRCEELEAAGELLRIPAQIRALVRDREGEAGDGWTANADHLSGAALAMLYLPERDPITAQEWESAISQHPFTRAHSDDAVLSWWRVGLREVSCPSATWARRMGVVAEDPHDMLARFGREEAATIEGRAAIWSQRLYWRAP